MDNKGRNSSQAPDSFTSGADPGILEGRSPDGGMIHMAVRLRQGGDVPPPAQAQILISINCYRMP